MKNDFKRFNITRWSVFRKENTEFFDLYMQSFIARIERRSTKFRVIDVHANVEFPFVSDVSTLVAQIQQWHNTLPYSAHTYNPNYANGYREDFQITEMMRKYGFNNDGEDFYILKNSDIIVERYKYSIRILTFSHNDDGCVNVCVYTSSADWGTTMISQKCKTVNEVENFVLTVTQAIAINNIAVYLPFMGADVNIGNLVKTTIDFNQPLDKIVKHENLKSFFIKRIKTILQTLENQ